MRAVVNVLSGTMVVRNQMRLVGISLRYTGARGVNHLHLTKCMEVLFMCCVVTTHKYLQSDMIIDTLGLVVTLRSPSPHQYNCQSDKILSVF